MAIEYKANNRNQNPEIKEILEIINRILNLEDGQINIPFAEIQLTAAINKILCLNQDNSAKTTI